MFRKYLSFILVGLLVLGTNSTVLFAQTKKQNSKVPNPEKVKAEVVKRGVNEKKRVRVKMSDGTKLKGYISQIGDDSFTLTISKPNQTTVIAYKDVTKVESGGLSGGSRIGIIVGAAAGGTALVLYLLFLNAIKNN